MSHFDHGPLATYNSLTDTHLAGYFANTRTRRHLIRAGLVSKNGVVVSETTYRLNMSRKEHKKHVKDMLAQAIVHKTLDLERSRQAEIKKKLEEIAKIQLVRRVRASRARKGDEDILPLLTLKKSRPYSSPTSKPRQTSPKSKHRPYSAPGVRADSRLSQTSTEEDEDVLYLDDEGRPINSTSHHELGSGDHVDTRHLYALDTTALRRYAMMMSQMEQGGGHTSPYLMAQVPLPPRLSLSGRSPRSARRLKSVSPQRPVGADGNIARLHRSESAKMHEGQQQSMCKVAMRYHGWELHLAREQMDPAQEIQVEQQHCGGNTLTVFKERLVPGSEFSFISYRHRGYPFSLTLYIDGHVDSRVSTCCEARHACGAKIGGKQGHFSLVRVEGAVPCYKCQVAKGVMIRSKAPRKQTKRPPQHHVEEVVVVSSTKDSSDKDKSAVNRSRETQDEEKPVKVAVERDDDNQQDDTAKESKKDNYEDDFEPSGSSSLSSSSSDSESESEGTARKDRESAQASVQSKVKRRDISSQVFGDNHDKDAYTLTDGMPERERAAKTSPSKNKRGCIKKERTSHCNNKSESSSLSPTCSYSSFPPSESHSQSTKHNTIPDSGASASNSVKVSRKINPVFKTDEDDAKADNEKVGPITVKMTVPAPGREEDTGEEVSDIESEVASHHLDAEPAGDPNSNRSPGPNRDRLPRVPRKEDKKEGPKLAEPVKSASPAPNDAFESRQQLHKDENQGSKSAMGQFINKKSPQKRGKSVLGKVRNIMHCRFNAYSSCSVDGSGRSDCISKTLSASCSRSSRPHATADDILQEPATSSASSSSSSLSSALEQDVCKSHSSVNRSQSGSSKGSKLEKGPSSSVKERLKGMPYEYEETSKTSSIHSERSAEKFSLQQGESKANIVEGEVPETGSRTSAISNPDRQDPENGCNIELGTKSDNDALEKDGKRRCEDFEVIDEPDRSPRGNICAPNGDDKQKNDDKQKSEKETDNETPVIVISHETVSDKITDNNTKDKNFFGDDGTLTTDDSRKGNNAVDYETVSEAMRCVLRGHESGDQAEADGFPSEEASLTQEAPQQARIPPIITIVHSDDGAGGQENGGLIPRSLFTSGSRDGHVQLPCDPRWRAASSLTVPVLPRDLEVHERWVGHKDLARQSRWGGGLKEKAGRDGLDRTAEESETKVSSFLPETPRSENNGKDRTRRSEERADLPTVCEMHVTGKDNQSPFVARGEEVKEAAAHAQTGGSEIAQYHYLQNRDDERHDDSDIEDDVRESSLSSSSSGSGLSFKSSRSWTSKESASRVCLGTGNRKQRGTGSQSDSETDGVSHFDKRGKFDVGGGRIKIIVNDLSEKHLNEMDSENEVFEAVQETTLELRHRGARSVHFNHLERGEEKSGSVEMEDRTTDCVDVEEDDKIDESMDTESDDSIHESVEGQTEDRAKDSVRLETEDKVNDFVNVYIEDKVHVNDSLNVATKDKIYNLWDAETEDRVDDLLDVKTDDKVDDLLNTELEDNMEGLLNETEDRGDNLLGIKTEGKVDDLLDVETEDNIDDLLDETEDTLDDLLDVTTEDRVDDILDVETEDKTDNSLDVQTEDKTHNLLDVETEDKTDDLLVVETENKIDDSLDVETEDNVDEILDVETEDKIDDLLVVETENKIDDLLDVETEDKTDDSLDVQTDDKTLNLLDVQTDDKVDDSLNVETEDTIDDSLDVQTEDKAHNLLVVETKNKIDDSLDVETEDNVDEILDVETEDKIDDLLDVETENKIDDSLDVETEDNVDEILDVETEDKIDDLLDVETENKIDDSLDVQTEDNVDDLLDVEDKIDDLLVVETEDKIDDSLDVQTEDNVDDLLDVEDKIDDLLVVETEDKIDELVGVESEDQKKESVDVEVEAKVDDLVDVKSGDSLNDSADVEVE